MKILGIALLVAIGLGACEKESYEMKRNPTSQESMMNGKWTIAEFDVNGIELSDDYSGYAFKFKANGVLTAERPERPIDGEWTVTDTGVVIRYRIFFGDDQFLNLLNNENWMVVEQDLVTLRLEGKRGDDGRTEIIFRKKLQ